MKNRNMNINKNHSQMSLSGIFNVCRLSIGWEKRQSVEKLLLQPSGSHYLSKKSSFQKVSMQDIRSFLFRPILCITGLREGDKAGVKARGAFTLIELLVVVLIIGILSALALPSYQMAVEKSRIAEANIVLKSIVNACELYSLENPGSFCTWDVLDIALDLPEANDGLERQAKYFYYSLETSNTEIYAGRGTNRNEEYYLNYTFAEEYKPSTAVRNCLGITDFGKKVCHSLCGANDCNY